MPFSRFRNILSTGSGSFQETFHCSWFFSRLICTSSRSSIRYHNKYYERVSKSRNRHNPLPHGIVKILITKRTYLANYVCRLQTHLSCSTAGTVSNFLRLLSIDVINFVLHVQTHDSIKVSLKTQSSVLIKRKLGMAFVFMVTHWDKLKRWKDAVPMDGRSIGPTRVCPIQCKYP